MRHESVPAPLAGRGQGSAPSEGCTRYAGSEFLFSRDPFSVAQVKLCALVFYSNLGAGAWPLPPGEGFRLRFRFVNQIALRPFFLRSAFSSIPRDVFCLPRSGRRASFLALPSRSSNGEVVRLVIHRETLNPRPRALRPGMPQRLKRHSGRHPRRLRRLFGRGARRSKTQGSCDCVEEGRRRSRRLMMRQL